LKDIGANAHGGVAEGDVALGVVALDPGPDQPLLSGVGAGDGFSRPS